MAKARQIVKRRKAVSNIKKITRTMQLVSTARFQQAFTRAMQGKPYTQKITELVGRLSSAGGEIKHELLDERPDAPCDLLLMISSNRGLCGSYNSGLFHNTMTHLRKPDHANTELHVVGKKGVAYFKFLRRALGKAYVTLGDRPTFAQVEPIATELIEAFKAGKYRKVYVSYIRFFSAGRQRPEIVQLLPIPAVAAEPKEAAAASKGGEVQFEFSPERDALLKSLLPQTVKVRLFQCFTDAIVSEQVMRMVAMKSATDAANDMIKDLTRRYNRARQSQITLELLDIVGGAEAIA